MHGAAIIAALIQLMWFQNVLTAIPLVLAGVTSCSSSLSLLPLSPDSFPSGGSSTAAGGGSSKQAAAAAKQQRSKQQQADSRQAAGTRGNQVPGSSRRRNDVKTTYKRRMKRPWNQTLATPGPEWAAPIPAAPAELSSRKINPWKN